MNQGREFILSSSFFLLKGKFFACRCRKYTTSLCCMWWECSVLPGVVPLLFAFLSDFSGIVGASSEVIILYPIFQLLIARGASLNAENVNGYDILHALTSSTCTKVCGLVSLVNFIISRVEGQKHT